MAELVKCFLCKLEELVLGPVELLWLAGQPIIKSMNSRFNEIETMEINKTGSD